MKKIANYVALVLLFLILVACEKKGSSVEVQGNGAEVISEVVDVMPQADVEQANIAQKLQNTANSNALKIVETVVPPYTELKVGPLSDVGYYSGYSYRTVPRTPNGGDYSSFDSFYSNTYSDYEKEFIDFILEENTGVSITSTNHENKTIEGLQKIMLPSGKEIVYEFQYQLDDKKFLYALKYLRLLDSNAIINDASRTRQPDVNIETIENDYNKKEKLEFFSQYINGIIDFNTLGEFKPYPNAHWQEHIDYNENNKNNLFSAKKYIKGNFINSGKDEYLVVFNRGLIEDPYGNLEELVEIMECIVVENDNIVMSYRLPILSIQEDPIYIHNWNIKYCSFCSSFSEGYVADFNKNGINEIVIERGMFEFVEDHFEMYFFIPYSSDLKYDWANEVFTSVTGAGLWAHFDFEWLQSVAWSEIEKCYIIVSEEQVEKK